MESFVAIDKAESIRWQNIAYENALKPPLGMALGSALLTTYSAEMPAIVAALRALGGFAEGEGKLGVGLHLNPGILLFGRVYCI
jgi:hypothetical protein